MLLKRIALGLLLVGSVGVSIAAVSPGFPRLGGYLIGSPQNYDDATYQAQLARLDFAIINTWPNWKGWSGSGSSPQQAIAAIKKLNPSIQIFQYEIIDSFGELNATSAGAYSEAYAKISSNSWWLYSGGSNSRVLSNWQSGGGGPFYSVNLTEFTHPDSNGDRWSQWFAKWLVRTFVTPTPALDGLFTDNLSWKPIENGDRNLDGANDPNSSVTVQQWHRQGFQDFLQSLHTSMPGKLLLGNLANWGDPNANLTGLSGTVSGGVIEGLMGPTWAVETWGGWKAALAWYRKAMANVLAPKLVIFHQMGLPTDFKAMRYGLTTCLMDDGYYQFVSNAQSQNGDYHEIVWFDEFDVSLGAATSAPPVAAWQNGVYRRDFQNGIALVNPKGNGSQTVTLETNFTKISGKQDRAVNSGQSVTTVTLQDRDGIVLLRAVALKKPAAPPVVSVQ